MKPPYFSLNIRLLFSDLFRIRIPNPDSNPDPKSGSETGSEMFISVPDRIRIRPKVFWSATLGGREGDIDLKAINCRYIVYKCVASPVWVAVLDKLSSNRSGVAFKSKTQHAWIFSSICTRPLRWPPNQRNKNLQSAFFSLFELKCREKNFDSAPSPWQ